MGRKRWGRLMTIAVMMGAAAACDSSTGPDGVATFIVISHQGFSGAMKCTGSADAVTTALPVLVQFLETLRPTTTSVGGA